MLVESPLAGELAYHVSRCPCFADCGRKRQTVGVSCASGGTLQLEKGGQETTAWSAERVSHKEGAGSCLMVGKASVFAAFKLVSI